MHTPLALSARALGVALMEHTDDHAELQGAASTGLTLLPHVTLRSQRGGTHTVYRHGGMFGVGWGAFALGLPLVGWTFVSLLTFIATLLGFALCPLFLLN